jgi:hypothetical protein
MEDDNTTTTNISSWNLFNGGINTTSDVNSNTSNNTFGNTTNNIYSDTTSSIYHYSGNDNDIDIELDTFM